MGEVGSYRIRWANVYVCNARRPYRARMCLAERKNWLCWWPLHDGEWRTSEEQAMRDIDYDKSLRVPLPPAAHVAAQ